MNVVLNGLVKAVAEEAKRAIKIIQEQLASDKKQGGEENGSFIVGECEY